MGKSFLQRVNWPSLGLIAASTVLLLFFQNCGKSAKDSDELSSLAADTPEVKKYKAAGFPYDVNINQLAFMTCPAAGTSKAFGEDIDNPFFTFRVGAFDNRSLATRFPKAFNPDAAVLTDPERTRRLVCDATRSKRHDDGHGFAGKRLRQRGSGGRQEKKRYDERTCRSRQVAL